MSDEAARMDAAIAAAKAEMAAGRITTAYNAYDFIGNLGIRAGFLNDQSPEEIAASVRNCLENHVPMFERVEGTRHFLVVEGSLIPLKGMKETFGITLADIEAVYLASQQPLELSKLEELLIPLEEGIRRFEERGFDHYE